MRCLLLDPTGRIDRVQENIDPTVTTKEGWKWYPVVSVARPPYDPELQVAEYVYEFIDDQAVEVWSIRDKTSREILLEKISRVEALDPLLLAVILDIKNEINMLKGIPAITTEDLKVQLQDLL